MIQVSITYHCRKVDKLENGYDRISVQVWDLDGK